MGVLAIRAQLSGDCFRALQLRNLFSCCNFKHRHHKVKPHPGVLQGSKYPNKRCLPQTICTSLYYRNREYLGPLGVALGCHLCLVVCTPALSHSSLAGVSFMLPGMARLPFYGIFGESGAPDVDPKKGSFRLPPHPFLETSGEACPISPNGVYTPEGPCRQPLAKHYSQASYRPGHPQARKHQIVDRLGIERTKYRALGSSDVRSIRGIRAEACPAVSLGPGGLGF